MYRDDRHVSPNAKVSSAHLITVVSEAGVILDLLSLKKPWQGMTEVAQEPGLGSRRAMILSASWCLVPEVRQLVGGLYTV